LNGIERTNNAGQHADGVPVACVSQMEAERILGLPATKRESTSGEKDHVAQFRCTYRAIEQNHPADTSNLYYISEEYASAELAHRAYAAIVGSNTSMPGQKAVDHLGDEAWLHSDKQHFHLLMFRKKLYVVRIKVNKGLSKTSLPDMMKVMDAIAVKL